MTYYVFKRFGEVDAARAYAKLTHRRLESLPIPRVDFEIASQRTAHEEVVEAARMLLDGTSELGGPEDLAIEQHLRGLWSLSSDDGAYINGEFAQLPGSQAIRDLFPNGRPNPEVRVQEVPLDPII